MDLSALTSVTRVFWSLLHATARISRVPRRLDRRGSTIVPDRGLATEALPAPQGDLDIQPVDLHRVGPSAASLSSDEAGARRGRGPRRLPRRLSCHRGSQSRL